ncbi:hypothetical protein [Arthrobacter sp. UYEF20]|uniref:hypothetical protein n=1 Tax=Arthrobacter sp. UYEF20 TaxID=1756363 RepID=UPI003391F363
MGEMMKKRRRKLLIATVIAVSISLAGISPAIASPAAISVSAAKPFTAPAVTINNLLSSTTANASAKRLLRPSYTVGKGATVVSARLTVVTAAGKVITPSATSVNVSPGSYRVTTTIRYTYKQGGSTSTMTVSSLQNLVIWVAKPVPATSYTEVFNGLNALRVKKGLPALKSNPALNGLIAVWAKSHQAAGNPMGQMAGLDRLTGPSVYGGSSVSLPKWVVNDLTSEPWFSKMLYDPGFNTLFVTTQVVDRRKKCMSISPIFPNTWPGLRRSYRGVARNNSWLTLRTAGLNLRRMVNLGLANKSGTWAIS